MPFADVNGHHIGYDVTGDGPALLFSHGFLMDRSMFAPQVAALRDHHRCVTWDERGFGETRAVADFSYWDSADDAVGLLDHLGIATAVLVGMSQGGFLSLRAALRYPERVAGLVLIDTQAGLEDPGSIAAFQAMHDEWVANGPANVRDAVAAVILGPRVDATPWFAKWDGFARDQLSVAFRTLVGREDIQDRLREISCPAIVLHGTDDIAITMDRAESLCAGLANCDGVVRVVGAGHASNLSHPDEVNAAIGDFLRRHA